MKFIVFLLPLVLIGWIQATKTIETLPENGRLEVDGVLLTVDDLPFIVTDETNLIFVPDQDFHGETSFGWSVDDVSSATVTLVVNPINDAPFAGWSIIKTVEDTEYELFILTDLPASDVDDDRSGFFSISGHIWDTELDCNENEIPDFTDIAEGTSEDVDENGIPDECVPNDNENDNSSPNTVIVGGLHCIYFKWEGDVDGVPAHLASGGRFSEFDGFYEFMVPPGWSGTITAVDGLVNAAANENDNGG